MFVMMISMLVVQVTFVQIVGVTLVLNRGMTATGTMAMVSVVPMVVSLMIIGHGLFSFRIVLRVMCLRQRVENQ